MNNRLSVREITTSDIDLIADYWLNSSPEHLTGMGVDLAKMPERAHWHEMLGQQLKQDYPEKQSYAIIWLLDGQPCGHCNVNKIVYGASAYMHLHLWQQENRLKGSGTELVKMSLPYFFDNLHLKKLYCEPYALNPAPNKTLQKIGFQLIKTHISTPGWLNFEQQASLWQLDAAQLNTMI